MNRVLSFRDLRLIPELAQYNEIELLNPELDSLVNSFLAKLGFDLDYGVMYEPSKHRDMQGKVGIGFRVIGELDINRNVVNSSLCGIEDRLAVAAYLDPTFIKEISPMLGSRIDYKAFQDEPASDTDDYAPDYTEDDYEAVSSQLKLLTQLRDDIRGSIYNEAGDIKAPNDKKEENAANQV
jgi:hypothetical protein